MTTSTSSQPSPAKRSEGRVTLGRLAEVGQVLVPGIYAWAVTVIPAASDRPTTSWSIVTASLAVVLLIAGAASAKRNPSLGHALGIWGFIIACVVTWLLSLPALQVDRLDPWRAAAGSIGWILYALGWGTPWRVGRHPEDDPRAQLHPKLEPRNPPRLRTALAVAAGTIGALSCMLLAWRATESDRGLLLHGAALACSIGIISAASTIGLAQGDKRTPAAPKQRITYAFPWVMAISALIVIAIAWMLGR